MKRSAKKAGLPLGENGKDQGTGKWLTVTTIDDLFRHNIAINLKKLTYQLLMYNADDDNELNQSSTGSKSEKLDT